MSKDRIIILLSFFLVPVFLTAQCPDKQWLKNRIIFLRDSSHGRAAVQLQELLKYEANARSCSFQNDSVRILLLQRISRIYKDSTEEYSASIYYLKNAINLVTANLRNPSIDQLAQVKNYYNLAACYDSLRKTAQKINAYDSCIASSGRLNTVNIYALYCLNEKVKYLYDMGDFNSCVNYADLGERWVHKYENDYNNKNDSRAAANYSMEFAVQKGNALIDLKKTAEAEIFIQRKIEECKIKKAENYFGSMIELLALTMVQNKSKKEAIAYFDRALDYYLKEGDNLSYKNALMNLGVRVYHEYYHDDNKAMACYKKALSYVVQNFDRSKLDSIISITIYCNIADILVSRQQYDSAQSYLKTAFSKIKKGTDENSILNSSADEFALKQKGDIITGLFLCRANTFFEQYKHTRDPFAINEAIRIYKLTDQLLDRIKTSQIEMQSKLFWRGTMHSFYEKAIEACKEGDRSDDAFYFFEKSRAILLFDQLSEQHWLDGADITRLQDLTEKISKLGKELLTAGKTPTEYAGLQDQLLEIKQKRYDVEQYVKERNPLYYQSFLSSNFTGLPDTKRYLAAHQQTLTEIFAGDSCVYAMIITDKKLYLNKINKAAYDSALNLCISFMSNPAASSQKKLISEFESNSKHLYDLIFKDAELPAGRAIISSDGNYFPFEALVTGFKNGKTIYFIEDHAVSYTYSAHYLMNEFAGHASLKTRDFLGVAPVKFLESFGLPQLFGSDASVQKLQSFYAHSDAILNEKASRNSFLKMFGQYQVIQLYSHSSDSSKNQEPVIYFADAPLYLSELSNLETPATKLVVLSACETGKGQFYQGEGVFSFSRAFAALGIPSCINNLWAVDNESTYDITRMFHQYVAKGFPLDIALQKAKLEFISTKNKLPYYWAATILSGKTDPIRFQNQTLNHAIVLTLIIIAAIVLLSILLRRFLLKKKPNISKQARTLPNFN